MKKHFKSQIKFLFCQNVKFAFKNPLINKATQVRLYGHSVFDSLHTILNIY
jgi:hypothetical protein